MSTTEIRAAAGQSLRRSALPALHQSLSDDELVDRVRHNDALAFESLMRRYNRRMFRVARSILRSDDLAEDAVQEAYIRAFTRLDHYVPAGRFGAWLCRIAVNEALMLKRGAGTRTDTLSLDSIDEADLLHSASFVRVTPDTDPVDNVQARQLLELAIDALPEAFRTVFMLRVVEQLSVSEVAEVLSLNESTVKTRMHRATRALHAHLSRRLSEERLSVFEFAGARCDRIVAAVRGRCFSAVHPP